jgi:hypothetical protein
MTPVSTWRLIFGGAITVWAVLPLASGRAATLGELFPAAAACFAVRHDEKRLAGNQRISAIRLSTPAESADAKKPRELIIFELDVTLRGDSKRMKTVGVICFRQDDYSWRCNEHTCNGRAIELKVETPDTLVLDLHERKDGVSRTGSLMMQGACRVPGRGEAIATGSGRTRPGFSAQTR